MDPTAISVFVGVTAIMLGIFGLMWQMNRQSGRLETKIETQGKDLETQIETQGRDLETQIETQGKDLQDEMREQGRRVSQSELDQARLNGVNSVLLRHTHTHERTSDAD